MKCQFCGTETPAGDEFCGRCGARVPIGGASPPSQPSQPTVPEGAAFGARPEDAPAVYGAPGAAEQPQAPRWETPYFDRDPNARTAAYEYANFGVRLGAWLLDYLFAILLALIPGIILAVVIALLVEAGQEAPLTAFEADQQDDDTAAGAIIGFFIGFVPALFAYWYIATALGGGWGKRICGIRIVKPDTGERPGFGSGLIRVLVTMGFGFVPLVGSLVQLVDHLSMLWDSDKQTFHDKAAGTVVVKA